MFQFFSNLGINKQTFGNEKKKTAPSRHTLGRIFCMTKFSEDTFTSWTKPPSDSEQGRLETSERHVKEAISEDDKLNKMSIEVFGQGSYANDTNVRLNSDIDINVMYMDGYFFELPDGATEVDVGIDKTPASSYSFKEFKNDVEAALVEKFGRDQVVRKNKCITVKATAQRVQTDVVPTWQFRRYSKDKSFVAGVRFYPDDSFWPVTNYPKQHIRNAVKKNSDTQKRFKRLTRLHRKLRYKMKEDQVAVSDNITSFLLECLIWNVPNRIMNNNETWTSRLRESIVYLYQQTKEDKSCTDWGEVSELLYLLRGGRKWSRSDVNAYMLQLWNYLELE